MHEHGHAVQEDSSLTGALIVLDECHKAKVGFCALYHADARQPRSIPGAGSDTCIVMSVHRYSLGIFLQQRIRHVL